MSDLTIEERASQLPAPPAFQPPPPPVPPTTPPPQGYITQLERSPTKKGGRIVKVCAIPAHNLLISFIVSTDALTNILVLLPSVPILFLVCLLLFPALFPPIPGWIVEMGCRQSPRCHPIGSWWSKITTLHARNHRVQNQTGLQTPAPESI